MKIIAVIIFLVISLFPINNLFSCTCGEMRYFINSHKDADIVCILKIESYLTFRDDEMPLSMEATISNVLAGTDTSSRITIWGDRGIDCAPYLINFPIGSTWLVALNQITDTLFYHRPGNTLGDYLFMVCAESYMEVKDTIVNGYFYDEVKTSTDYSLKEITEIIQGTTDVSSDNNHMPNEFRLFQNYPNPFNPNTKISYYLPGKSYVKIEVVNSVGQSVATLESGIKNIGNYDIDFNGNERPSGIYFCRVFIDHELRKTIKMVLLK